MGKSRRRSTCLIQTTKVAVADTQASGALFKLPRSLRSGTVSRRTPVHLSNRMFSPLRHFVPRSCAYRRTRRLKPAPTSEALVQFSSHCLDDFAVAGKP